MAVREYSKVGPAFVRGVYTFEWTGLLNGDTGRPVRVPRFSDKTVHVTGTQGAGGNCRIEGTNDPASGTYTVLADPQGTALNVGTVPQIEQILENPLEIRPNVTAGDGTTSYTVRLTVTTTRP